MKNIILISSMLSLALTQTIIAQSPVPSAQPNDYSISLLAKGKVDMCKGAIIAPSWVLTAKHCATSKLSHVTDGKLQDKVKIDKKIRFKKSDIALLKLVNPVFNKKDAVLLSAQPLLKKYGELDYKKVTHNARRGTPWINENLVLRAKNLKNLKSLTPVGKAGSSGSPWVVSTDVGDVVVGVTHGGGYAPQVSLAKSWIDVTLKTYTPNEHIKWVKKVVEESSLVSAQPNDYSISLLAKGKVDMCKGAIIAPSWVLTAKHCATSKLSHVTDGKLQNKVKIDKKIRFKKSDIALLKLVNPVFDKKNAVMLSAQPLLKEYGKLDYRKVTHNARRGTPWINENLILRAKNLKNLKSLTPVGKAGSSGSPWVVSTDVGDVVVGVTHGGGYAPQVSLAKSWIDAALKVYTPNEHIKWLTDREMILDAQ